MQILFRLTALIAALFLIGCAGATRTAFTPESGPATRSGVIY